MYASRGCKYACRGFSARLLSASWRVWSQLFDALQGTLHWTPDKYVHVNLQWAHSSGQLEVYTIYICSCLLQPFDFLLLYIVWNEVNAFIVRS